MIKKLSFLIVMAVLCLIVATPAAAQETSHVRFAHFVFNGPQVNIFVDNKVFTGEDKQPYALNTLELSRSYLDLSADTSHTFVVVESGKTVDSALFKPAEFKLKAGHNYALAIMGNVEAKDLHFTLLDETEAINTHDPKASAISFVFNNLYGIPAVDFYWADKLVIDKLAYGDYIVAQDDPKGVGSRLTPHGDAKTTIFEYKEAIAGPPQTIAFFGFVGKFPGTMDKDYTTPYLGNFIGKPFTRDAGSVAIGGLTKVSLSEPGLREQYKLVLDKPVVLDIMLKGDASNSATDAYLRIFDAQGNVLAQNDDFDHAVSRDAGVKGLKLDKGTYIIQAGTYFDTFLGDYILSVTATK